MRRSPFLLLLGFALLSPALTTAATAAKPKVKVKVEVEGVPRKLAQNIHSSLSLENADKDELDEERIRHLHAEAPAEIDEALQPFGYYRSHVRSELKQQGTEWIAHYDVDAGP